jgi:hypothetical protein
MRGFLPDAAVWSVDLQIMCVIEQSEFEQSGMMIAGVYSFPFDKHPMYFRPGFGNPVPGLFLPVLKLPGWASGRGGVIYALVDSVARTSGCFQTLAV